MHRKRTMQAEKREDHCILDAPPAIDHLRTQDTGGEQHEDSGISPMDFYRKISARPDTREILKRLADR